MALADIRSEVHLPLTRRFTRPGVDPFDEVEWELRTAIIEGPDGVPVFKQEGVEFPKFWSQQATNVVASKYFRGPLGTPQRERSLRQLISRVVDTIAGWGPPRWILRRPGGDGDLPGGAEVPPPPPVCRL